MLWLEGRIYTSQNICKTKCILSCAMGGAVSPGLSLAPRFTVPYSIACWIMQFAECLWAHVAKDSVSDTLINDIKQLCESFGGWVGITQDGCANK